MDKEFDVCLIGTRGVGKTTFVNRITTGDFQEDYTLGSEIKTHVLNFKVISKNFTGTVRIRLHDFPGQRLFVEKNFKADAAILMFSYQDMNSVDQLDYFGDDFREVNPNSPVVVVGGKLDLQPKVKCGVVHKKCPWVKDIIGHSTKTRRSFYVPFIVAIQLLLNDDTAGVDIIDPKDWLWSKPMKPEEIKLLGCDDVKDWKKERLAYLTDRELSTIHQGALGFLAQKFNIEFDEGDLILSVKKWANNYKEMLREKSKYLELFEMLFDTENDEGKVADEDLSLLDVKQFVTRMKEEWSYYSKRQAANKSYVYPQ